jgi:nitroreductase
MIIAMTNDLPTISAEKEAACYQCQHCFAICPTGAVSILGLNSADSHLLADAYPTPAALETLIKGRRSIRKYRDENLDADLFQHLLDVASHAPTGKNEHQVRYTVVDDKAKLAKLRDLVMDGLAALVRDNALPEQMGFFAGFVHVWEKHKVDIIFRGAPHLLITSTPRTVASPLPDCLITMSYFELFAQSNGVGTVWNGLAKWAITDLVPDALQYLDIPDDHLVGYAMSFGLPAVHYTRTVQRKPFMIHRVA